MTGYVYFIRVLRDDGPIKIGCSIEPVARLVALSTWCPYPTEVVATVPGNFDLERRIQNCFADLHLHREWFRPEQRLISAIHNLQAGMPIEAAMDLEDIRGDIKAEQYRLRSVAIAARRAQRVAA